MSLCGSVSLFARISPEPQAQSLPNFLHILPMSMARSSSGMFTIGLIAYRREGFSSLLKMHYRPGKGMGVHSAGEVCYMRLPCFIRTIFLTQEFITRRVVKYSDFGPSDGYISETVQDRR